MSDLFHKSCYTSRSPGYKYRTLSTNTGDRKRRDAEEEDIFEKKFKELRRVILSRVNKEVREAKKTRDAMKLNTDKIDSKIESMIQLQSVVGALKKSLRAAEGAVENIEDRVNKLDQFISGTGSDGYSVRSLKSSRSHPPIEEADEDGGSIVTHI